MVAMQMVLPMVVLVKTDVDVDVEDPCGDDEDAVLSRFLMKVMGWRERIQSNTLAPTSPKHFFPEWRDKTCQQNRKRIHKTPLFVFCR